MLNNNEIRPIGWTNYDESVKFYDMGLPESTCDLYWHTDVQHYPDPIKRHGCENIPCWSVGALEKILPKTFKLDELCREYPLKVEYGIDCTYVYYDIPRDFAFDNKLTEITLDRYETTIDGFVALLTFLIDKEFLTF